MFDFKDIDHQLLNKEFIYLASQECEYDFDTLRSYILISLGEARHTLKVIEKYDLKNRRILEFGSGLGIASLVLNLNGYNITSFEPGGLGFEKNILVNQFIKKHFDLEHDLIDTMSDIKPNSFDFIFSNNVLEHIKNVGEVVSQLDQALTDDGEMVHNIPNYIIPYEPHFGILFFPIFPKKMSFLIPKKITNTDLWKSINFINLYDVKSYAKSSNAKVIFERELMYKTIIRIENDEGFKERHISISKLINIFKKLGILRLFKFFPPALNTPMVFEWSKR